LNEMQPPHVRRIARRERSGLPQKDLMIRAAFSLSTSSVAGQKASRCIRALIILAALLLLFAALMLILERPLVVFVLAVLDLLDHPNRPPPVAGLVVELA
jgi:hypothetical protein